MRYTAFLLLIGLSLATFSQQPPGTHQSVSPSQLRWTSTALPNLEMAVVSGDPAATGSYVIRLRARTALRVPPHWHPTDENLTVISGRASMGMGDRFLESELTPLPAGGYVFVPKETRHFARLAAGTVVQLHGDGPFVTNWVNSGDLKKPKPNDADSMSDRTRMKKDQDKR